MIAGTLRWRRVAQPTAWPSCGPRRSRPLTYHLNWRLIVDQQSYFEAADGPSALEHLWSLSIEEQFYLVFPLLAAFVLAKRPAGGGALSCWAWPWCPRCCASCCTSPAGIRPASTSAPTPACPACCSGSALGLFWTPNRLRPHATRRFAVTWTRWPSAGAGVVAWYAFGLDEQRPARVPGRLHRGAAGHARAAGRRRVPGAHADGPGLLSAGPLRWVGQRSYGIYLIHWPVIVFLSDAPGRAARDPRGRGASRWRSCSGWPPCRTGCSSSPSASAAAGDRPATRATGWSTSPGRPAVALGHPGGGLAGRSPATVASPARSSPPRRPTATDPESVVIGPGEATTTTGRPPTTTAAAATCRRPGRCTTTSPAPPRRRRPAGARYASTTAIGDSVMRRARRRRSPTGWAPSLTVDAEVGRQIDEAAELVAAMAADGTLGQVVLVHLGTNGPFTPEQIDELFAAAGPDRQVLLVNVVRAAPVGGRGQRPARRPSPATPTPCSSTGGRSPTAEPGLLARRRLPRHPGRRRALHRPGRGVDPTA